MKKTLLIPEVRVIKLEAIDILTSSASIMMCNEDSDADNSGKGRERNSIWDD